LASSISVLPVLGKLDQRFAWQAVDIDLYQGMRARETRHELRQQIIRIIVGHTETDDPGEFRFRKRHHCFIVQPNDAPGIIEKPLAVGG
jgi:hypothetical protein